jgi:GGDEF domain-containing protein
MATEKLKKTEYDRIGRSFSLLFNRSTMYQAEHPYTAQSIKDFAKTIAKGLALQSPLVIIMNREQFFVEEEPFDPRLNLSRMVSHFKKAGLQSISFERGLQTTDVSEFVRIFTDLTVFPNAEAMKKELTRKDVTTIRINHVFYQKVTENDAVVSRDELQKAAETDGGTEGQRKGSSILDVVAGGLVAEELEQAMSLRMVIDNPGAASRALIDADLASARSEDDEKGGAPSGPVIVKQLGRLRSEVEKVAPEMEGAGLAELAEAVFDMKRKLLSGIETHKTVGVVYEDEALIRSEADQLTDRVFIQLVRQEYRGGEISVKRLGQILRRLVPDPAELQRLLPSLKQALLEEGMPPTDFAELVEELGRELQSQGLAHLLKQSAAAIGVDGDDLVQEMMTSPQIAAELIYLSAEIRKGAGDEKLLSDLLVDYVERVGGQLSLDEATHEADSGSAHLDKIYRRVQSQILDRLKSKDVKPDILREVEERLKRRMEEMLERLQGDWDKRQALPVGAEQLREFSILGALEAGTDEGEELHSILAQVKSSLRERDIDETNFQEVYREIVKGRIAWKKQKEKKDLPSGALNRSSILFFVEKEIQRAVRYGTPFSIILLAIVRAIPRAKAAPGAINQQDVYQAVLERLARVVRDPDMVGSLDKSRMIWLLPMTIPEDVQTARQRIVGELHRHVYNIKGVPLKVRLATAVKDFSHEELPPLRTFLKRAETTLHEMVVRLRNIKEMM